MKRVLLLILFFSSMHFILAEAPIITNGEIHSVKPRSGDGLDVLLQRYELLEANLKKKFLELNNLQSTSPLYKHKRYKLPVYLYNYNGKSIRSTLGIDDWTRALHIKEYNERLLEKGVRKTHFTKSNILWVPFSDKNNKAPTPLSTDEEIVEAKKVPSSKPQKLTVRGIKDNLYGHNYASTDIIDQSLKHRVFYVVSGHGGPDPGAVCDECSSKLCEDEYAYDVSLRLARILRQHGAKVEMVVQDKNDGIRDSQILKCDTDERMADGSRLPANQLTRLRQRTNYINKKYKEYKDQGYKDQSVISLHIDSNSESHKQDVFFCYYKGSKASRKLAVQLRNKFQEKYDLHQKNRGYKGYLHRRNIFVLRKTAPPAVLIELANIRNKNNHKRILQKDNRQALAKWIYEGLAGDDLPLDEQNRVLASSN